MGSVEPDEGEIQKTGLCNDWLPSTGRNFRNRTLAAKKRLKLHLPVRSAQRKIR